MNLAPELLFDGYKCDHRRQYPTNSQLVFSNMTARGSRVEGTKKVIKFGLQYYIKEYLIKAWNEQFFQQPIEKIIKRYTRRLNNYLGPNQIGQQHIRDLHALGHLPLEIWALPEGSAVDIRVPMFVVWNTDSRFFWLTNAIETSISAIMWGPCTSATTAVMYRKIFNGWAQKTNPEMIGFVPWQGHDFSFRGHFGIEAAVMSAAAHLLAFTGTDTLPAIDFLEDYYNADSDTELVGGSVSATEHSVMCMGECDNEVETFRRLIEDVYPNGIVSIVSDTWDFWNVINPNGGIVATLKDKILARDGKVVIRPDSGDPVDIVCGVQIQSLDEDSDDLDDAKGWAYDELVDQIGNETPHGERGDETNSGLFRYNGKVYLAEVSIEWNRHDKQYYYIDGSELTKFEEIELTVEQKGLIECLWEIFGGTTTSTGYLQLDSHIGAIYGDSITLDRAKQISERLAAKGFASTNLVYGIGSFTYQGAVTPNAIITRDTYMFAVKSTYGEVIENGVVKGIEIFKDPITDSGMKKSAKGLTAVYEKDGDFILKDQATWDEVKNCAFVQVFKDSQLKKDWKLSEVRAQVEKNW